MRLFRYLLQYRFRDIADFLRNRHRPPDECSGSLEEKTVVISGATSGIGLEMARFASKIFNPTTLEKPAPHDRDSSSADAAWTKRLTLCGLP